MLSYLANGIAVAAEAVEAEVPVVVLRHEIVADSGGAGYHRGGASVVRDSLWLEPAAALADDLAGEGGRRVRGQRRRRRQDRRRLGVRAGCRRHCADAALGQGSYADATPLAGVVDRRRTRPTSTAATSTRTGSRCIRRRPARRCATSITAAAAGATRSSASRSASARRPRRLRHDRGRGARLRRRRRSATPSAIPRASRSTRETTRASREPDAELAELEGSVAIVTGAAGGVGREVVRLLLDAGAVGRRRGRRSRRGRARDSQTGGWSPLVGDVADSATARAAVELRTRAVRPARHPRQQRSALPAQADARDHRRRMGRGAPDERPRRVRALPRGAAADSPNAAARS